MKYSIFSKNIKDLINKYANGKKNKFAKLIGHTGTGVARWVNGECLPSGDTLLKIKEKCEIPSIDWLLTGENPEHLKTEYYENPQFQEHLEIYRRYQKLQRNADRKTVDFCFLNIQNHLDLFEQEIKRRKAFKTIQGARSSSSDPETA